MQTVDKSQFEERDGRHISGCSPWRTPNVSHYFGLGQAFKSFMLNRHMGSVIATYLAPAMGLVDPAWFQSTEMVLVSTLVLPWHHSLTKKSLVSSLAMVNAPSPVPALFPSYMLWDRYPGVRITAALSDCPGGQQAPAVPWHGCPQVCLHEIAVYSSRPRIQQSSFWVHGIQRPF